MSRFERIIFLQGDEATKALKLLDKRGTKAAFEHLKQWHYPGEHDTSDKLGHGSRDTVIRDANYILTVNWSMGYIGLEFDTKQGSKQ